jgi:hypothetical protein
MLHYYWRWLKAAFTQSIGPIDLWTGLAGAALGIVDHYVPAAQLMTAYAWQIPIWALSGVFARAVLCLRQRDLNLVASSSSDSALQAALAAVISSRVSSRVLRRAIKCLGTSVFGFSPPNPAQALTLAAWCEAMAPLRLKVEPSVLPHRATERYRDQVRPSPSQRIVAASPVQLSQRGDGHGAASKSAWLKLAHDRVRRCAC